MRGETFRERFDRSHLAVWVAASWHWSSGTSVKIPDVSQVGPDNGDLFIQPGHGRRWRRVEVKHLRHDWTGRRDFPFPKVLVCATHSWDRAEPKPIEYLIFNRVLTGAIRISATTRQHWWREEIHDRRRDEEGRQECYCVHPELCSFEDVPDDLVVKI